MNCSDTDPAQPTWKNIGIDPRNNFAEQFFIIFKIQDCHRGSKIEFPTDFELKSNILALHTETVHPIWTKIVMNIVISMWKIFLLFQCGRQYGENEIGHNFF